jgi:hypothetical protein
LPGFSTLQPWPALRATASIAIFLMLDISKAKKGIQ